MAPLENATFQLDTSGVIGFFGGDEAISAMATVHIYEGRKWLGWYNSPGSYTVARQYGRLAHSRFWDGLFPGVAVDPEILFELDGKRGPEYIGTKSGTIIKDTGHLGHLFLKECQRIPQAKTKIVAGRVTSRVCVTVASFPNTPRAQMLASQQQRGTSLLASIPILTSLGGCLVCAYFADWFSFFLIALGIVTNGVSCLVIGSGQLMFVHPQPSQGSPEGDGILKGDSEMVVLLGKEAAVNSVTRGRFSLRFRSEPEYRNIGLCAMLLIIQFLLQLLVTPMATLFGQIIFLVTLGVSWIYNCYLSSMDKEEIQRKVLMSKVLGMQSSSLRKYSLGTRTTMVVFVLLMLRPQDSKKFLDDLLPNDTPTWRIWKKAVLERVERMNGSENDAPWSFSSSEYGGVVGKEEELLRNLYGDAMSACQGYLDARKEIQTCTAPAKESPQMDEALSNHTR